MAIRSARWLWMIVLLLLAAALAGYGWRRELARAPQYSTVQAGRGSVTQAVVASGTVNPVTTIQVGTYVSGVVQAVLCDFNAQVRAGQLCARIDPRPYQAALEREAAALGTARAQLAKDQAAIDYARQADSRSRQLLARGYLSQDAVDSTTNAYRQAQAQLAVDQATVVQHEALWKAANINLGYTEIVSPVDGTVVSRNVNQGQTVAASFQTPTLFLIATDLTRMQVDTNVSESDIGRIAQGNAATFTVAAYPERRFSGRVLQIRQAPQTVQNVVTYIVVVGVDNADLALKPGMTASVSIVTRQAAQVLRVPGQALRYRPGGQPRQPGQRAPQVWVLDDGKPRAVPVTVGLDDDSFVEITGGALREGDTVILSESAPAAGRTQPAGPAAPVRR